MNVTWYGPAVERKLRDKLGNNLDDAAVWLKKQIRIKIGTIGPPRSTPGNPPHIDHNELHSSFAHDTDKASLVAEVGSDSPYVLALELGHPETNLAPRPHILSTLIEESDHLAREICKP